VALWLPLDMRSVISPGYGQQPRFNSQLKPTSSDHYDVVTGRFSSRGGTAPAASKRQPLDVRGHCGSRSSLCCAGNNITAAFLPAWLYAAGLKYLNVAGSKRRCCNSSYGAGMTLVGRGVTKTIAIWATYFL